MDLSLDASEGTLMVWGGGGGGFLSFDVTEGILMGEEG